jgi:hypothetical protein
LFSNAIVAALYARSWTIELQKRIVSAASSNVKHLWICFLDPATSAQNSSTIQRKILCQILTYYFFKSSRKGIANKYQILLNHRIIGMFGCISRVAWPNIGSGQSWTVQNFGKKWYVRFFIKI